MNLNIPEIIRKKRDGFELTSQETEFFVQSVAEKSIDDSQIGAMLMAMFLNKQSLAETIALTRAMSRSGEVLRFESHEKNVLVDKHSTGGVGDKTSIILAPALAACGLGVPMISGRGLGYTGGTLDKLESIPGYQVHLGLKQMNECLAKAGCFICGASESVAPADRILYKIRDITSTVEDRSLIAASILSKKVAEGIGTLVVDLKCGSGSIFKTETESLKMAELLSETGKALDLNMKMVISEMEAPLGQFVGNALEVVESVMCMRNECKNAVSELVELLGGVILESKGLAKSVNEGEQMIRSALEDSRALKCFFHMLVSQGVSERNAEDLCAGNYWKVLPKAGRITRFGSPLKGVVAAINARDIGRACWLLGAGRVHAESQVDHSVGVVLLKCVGDAVEESECWVEVHHSTEELPLEVEILIQRSLIVEEKGEKKIKKLRTRVL